MKIWKRPILGAAAGVIAFGAVVLTLDVEDYYSAPIVSHHLVKFGKHFAKSSKVVAISSNCVGGLQSELLKSAVESNLDPKLLLAIIQVESGCNLGVRSSRGAIGLMQILPSTAKAVGIINPARGAENIRAGARYLRVLQDQFNSDIRLVLAAYNAGPNAVKHYQGIPPYPETQEYVRSVMDIYARLSKTPNAGV